MKPRELYSGNAPTAMGQMGAGLMEAGANIGRSLQQGYSAMGQGLAQGVTAAAQAYGDYKQAKTSNDITKMLIEDPEHGKMLGLDPNAPNYEERKKAMLGQLNQTIKEHGQFGGAQFSKQVLAPIYANYALGQEYAQKMKIATALSDPEKNLKTAQAEKEAAQTDVLRRKASPAPAPDFSKPFDFNAPVGKPQLPATPPPRNAAPPQRAASVPAERVSGGVVGELPRPAQTPMAVQEAASGLFPEPSPTPRKFDYENLLPEHKAYVDASSMGSEVWNVLGEDQQIRNLMNIDKPNFGLRSSRR